MCKRVQPHNILTQLLFLSVNLSLNLNSQHKTLHIPRLSIILCNNEVSRDRFCILSGTPSFSSWNLWDRSATIEFLTYTDKFERMWEKKWIHSLFLYPAIADGCLALHWLFRTHIWPWTQTENWHTALFIEAVYLLVIPAKSPAVIFPLEGILLCIARQLSPIIWAVMSTYAKYNVLDDVSVGFDNWNLGVLKRMFKMTSLSFKADLFL